MDTLRDQTETSRQAADDRNEMRSTCRNALTERCDVSSTGARRLSISGTTRDYFCAYVLYCQRGYRLSGRWRALIGRACSRVIDEPNLKSQFGFSTDVSFD